MGTKAILVPAYLLKISPIPKHKVASLEIAQGDIYAALISAGCTSSASQSGTTAAVQDCSLEPSGSPENGSKYSAKPPSAI
jgi:hypothetical protein